VKRFVQCGAGAVLMAAALTVASPSAASTMLATFEGYASGVDQSNFFGLGTSFTDARFVAQFTYDTALGQSETNDHYDARFGGPGFGGGVSPILGASLTLNNVRDSFDVGQDGSANVFNQNGWAQTFFYSNFFGSLGSASTWNYLQLFVLDAPSPILLTTPYTGTDQPVNSPPLEGEVAYHSVFVDGAQTVNYSLTLSPTSVTLSAIPEPSTWMLLLTGFFGLGLLLRRARRYDLSLSAAQ